MTRTCLWFFPSLLICWRLFSINGKRVPTVMNALFGFIVHSLLSSPSLSYCLLPPSFPLLSYLSQPLTSPSILDDIIWNSSSPGYGLRYGPYLPCPSTTRFPDPRNLPSIGLHPSWFIPHFFLIHVLESRKDNLDIQVKYRDLPSMSSLSPPHVPPERITWKYRITRIPLDL